MCPVTGDTGDRIEQLQREHDPRLLLLGLPHVTIIGSSGMGPIVPSTTVEQLEATLRPIAESTSPITLKFGAPTRFMNTEIVVLPLDPHGPLRTLHERIKTSDLRMLPPRFFFTPHVTLSLYRELPREALLTLLSERFPEPIVVDRMDCYLTKDTGETRHLLTLPLSASPHSSP